MTSSVGNKHIIRYEYERMNRVKLEPWHGYDKTVSMSLTSACLVEYILEIHHLHHSLQKVLYTQTQTMLAYFYFLHAPLNFLDKLMSTSHSHPSEV